MIRAGHCAVVLIIVAGCGDKGPNPFRVSGQVTWNGAALSEGKILFEAGDGTKEISDIRQGKYEAPLAGGAYTVRITSEQVVPGKTGAMKMPLIEQIIPKKFNSDSELRITVDKSKTENFDLTGP